MYCLLVRIEAEIIAHTHTNIRLNYKMPTYSMRMNYERHKKFKISYSLGPGGVEGGVAVGLPGVGLTP